MTAQKSDPAIPPAGSSESGAVVAVAVAARIAWGLGWPITAALALWCLAVLALWVPPYLTLPLFTDHDHFAMLAQSWDAGVLPYRTHHSNQFPGELYLFWALGRGFGWGRALPFYAADVALVVGFGLLLVAWSVRHFGRALFGVVGFAVFLGFYASEAFELTGQREWHVMAAVVLSLLALRPGSGRTGLVVSALAFAVALLIRPQAVLAAPGLLLALGARAPEGDLRQGLRAIVGWGALVTLAFGLGLVPLAAGGLLGDFLHDVTGTRLAIGRGYGDLGSLRLRLRTHLALCHRHPQFLVLPVLVLVLSLGEPAARRRYHRALAVAALGLGLYQAISPAEHRYYEIPPSVASALLAGVVAGQLLGRLPRTEVALAVLLLVLGLAGWTARPTYTSVTAARQALADLRSDRVPLRPPPAYWDYVGYDWPELQAALEYLRRTTTPDTPVASLCQASTALVSAIPRRQGLPVDFLLFLLSGGAYRDEVLATLRDDHELVILWNPSIEESHWPGCAVVFEAVRNYYEPDWAFGPLEVWRHRQARRPGPAPAPRR